MSCERLTTDLRNTVNGLYSLGQTIGTGHFAVVKLARHVFTQKEVAVKVIDKSKLDEVSRTHLFQEVQCMKLVQHPNVVRLYEVIDTPSKLYLILEFADGGDMYDYLIRHANGLNESLARKYFRQICRALKYCHEMYVCHRDLKPENLVFFEKQGVVKLTDFGFSNLFSPGQKLLTSCGSLAYSAPEILLGDPYDAPAVDIWSLGVILYMLVTGRAPFQEANDSETVMMILDCSYKVPAHISPECQSLIYHMIVREPEKRATLDEVMSDIWYRQHEHDYEDEDENQHNIDWLKLIPQEDQESILQQMVDGNIANKETILKSLTDNQYNHLTATYYLLAENVLHDKYQGENRNVKRTKFFLQSADDQSKEQVGVSLPTTTNSAKENTSSSQGTPRHSLDASNEQICTVENEEERLSSQQRGITPNVPTTVTQAMKIILEEDENPELTPTENVGEAIQKLANLSKLNKITENDENDEPTVVNSSNNLIENSTTTGNVLRSKDLRSVVEIKRRNFSRSCSSSDSEDNGSGFDMNRFTNAKYIRSQTSYQESDSNNNNRGRSMSNIEHTSHETTAQQQQQTTGINHSDSMRRKAVSRTSSMASGNRSTISHPNDDINADFTNSSPYISDRMHGLSTEHRLANPSLMSIASRTSLRHSTPRESTVFTKVDAPNFIRLLQQKHHQEIEDAVKILHENLPTLSTASNQEHVQTPVIVEEDVTSPTNKNSDSTVAINANDDETKPSVIMPIVETTNLVNGHVSSSRQSIASKLRNSLIKRKRIPGAVNSKENNEKQKRLTNKQQVCCTIS